jgi:hypothetical protein
LKFSFSHISISIIGGKKAIDPAIKEYVDNAVLAVRLERSGPFGSVSRAEVYHKMVNDDQYDSFDILQELKDPPVDSLIAPEANDPLFQNSIDVIPKNSICDNKRQCTTGRTQELMFDRVKDWKPFARTIDVSRQNIPNFGKMKLDIILREDEHLNSELAVMAVGKIIKKLPEGNLQSQEFAPDEMGQCLEFGMKVMGKQPWRPHVYVVLSDTRRFKFFKVSRCGMDDLVYEHSDIFLDAKGWEVFRLLVSQSPQTLGYVNCSIQDWTIGSVLGIGGTAVVVAAHQSSQCSMVGAGDNVDAVAKLYIGLEAMQSRNQEAAALEALIGISNIPSLIKGAPNMTVSNLPVLLLSPRGYAPGDKVFPLISDYVPLVDVLHAVHGRGWRHNDVAPANILFRIANNGSPEVFLNDFGSATRFFQPHAMHNPKSRPLFYHYNASSAGFDFGTQADLCALVLSIFDLTQKDAFDIGHITTAKELERVAMRAQPWKNALIAAKNVDYEGVKAALNSTRVNEKK